MNKSTRSVQQCYFTTEHTETFSVISVCSVVSKYALSSLLRSFAVKNSCPFVVQVFILKYFPIS